jgi:hypothetical protein
VHEDLLVGPGIEVTHLVADPAVSPVRAALFRHFAEFVL